MEILSTQKGIYALYVYRYIPGYIRVEDLGFTQGDDAKSPTFSAYHKNQYHTLGSASKLIFLKKEN
jgi:hypothetical protein